MIVDPAVLPGLLLLGAELAVLAAVGFVVVRVALRQADELSALAQGLVVGPALWGIVVNFVMYAAPGRAGAAVGWILMLGFAGVLAWRAPSRLRISVRTLAGFAGAVLVLGWAALASRQLVGIANFYVDLGLAASIRAGGFPVVLPSSPDATEAYHYGASLLVGLLTPPAGPDLAFVWELLGVYAWVGLALVAVSALRLRGSWLSALTLAPLLLSYGLHTFVWRAPSGVAGILSVPIPIGLPAAGLRAALGDIYWAAAGSFESRITALPDLWMPAFTLGYSLVFVVLAHAARSDRPTWLGSITLAGLVGFLGLLVTTLVPVVVVLWAGLEALRLVRARRLSTATLEAGCQSAAGPAVAGLLLLFGGGALSGILDGGGNSGLAWSSSLDAGHWQVLGDLGQRAGGVGLLSVGPLGVATAAMMLTRRDRLVLVLAAGAGLLALAWLAFDYPPRPQDLGRLAGHARNLALMALLLALNTRLCWLPSRRWRYAAGALLVGLVVWPTVVAPARSLAASMGQGVQLANANDGWRALREQDENYVLRRHPMSSMSSRLATHIREHTAVDELVLDTSLNLAVLLNTGRSSNWGFVGVTQHSWRPGPEHQDALFYLEPAAFRRLGLGYVYATDSWVAELPARAQGWLSDPRYFDLLGRVGDEALYRARSAFLTLETIPHPDSYEALRAMAPATVVYLPPQADWDNKLRVLRVASAVSHTQLAGAGGDPEILHLRSPAPWTVTSLEARIPDTVALPLLHDAWLYPPAQWRQLWRNPPDRIAVYAPSGTRSTLPDGTSSPISVDLTDVRADDARLTFTATLNAHAPLGWTGQDWVVVPVDRSPFAIPELQRDGQPTIWQWFAGQAPVGARTTTHSYLFDARTFSLAVRGEDGNLTTVQASKRMPSPGTWMLAMRLNRLGDRGVQEPLFAIPVLRFEVSDAGTVSSLQIYEDTRGWRSP